MTREETISSLKFFSPLNDKNIDWEKADLISLVCLDTAREIAGVPFFITSNYRTPEHSVEVGGIINDSHTESPCTAFDISLARPDGKWNSQAAFKIIPALIQSGFNRIGVNKNNNHIHCDRSKNLPQDVFWFE